MRSYGLSYINFTVNTRPRTTHGMAFFTRITRPKNRKYFVRGRHVADANVCRELIIDAENYQLGGLSLRFL